MARFGLPSPRSNKSTSMKSTSDAPSGSPATPVIVGVAATEALVAWNGLNTDEGHTHALRLMAERGWICPLCSHANNHGGVGCLTCLEERPMQALFPEAPLEQRHSVPTHEYTVKFRRSGKTLASWKSSEFSSAKYLRLSGLNPGSWYELVVHSRPLDMAGGHGKRKVVASPPSRSLEFVTLTDDHQLRLENLGRLITFLDPGMVMHAFPEDPEKRDTLLAKGNRALNGAVAVAKWLPIGGKYVDLAGQVWKAKKIGVAASIFQQKNQQLVVALSSFVASAAKGLGLDPRDVTMGSYYMLWERKRERHIFPDLEHEHHRAGLEGVLLPQAPMSLVEELAWFSPLAHFIYRGSPAQIQWTLRTFPSRHQEAGCFEVVMCNTVSRPNKPAFALMVHRRHRLAVLAIRGTKQMDDIVTDLSYDVATAPFKFHLGDSTVEGAQEVGPDLHVHQGMLHSAQWLIHGEPNADTFLDKKAVKTPRGEASHETQGCGLGYAIRKLHDEGFKLVFTGHSLGAGVATIAALVLCDRDPDLKVKVYAYGTPACVDERLAEACKGELAKQYASPGSGAATPLPGLGYRVTVKNFINRDDVVPRLSLNTARLFAMELKESRSRWSPLLNQDLVGFTQRAQTLWAPPQRKSMPKNPRFGANGKRDGPTSAVNRLTMDATKDPITRLVPPGIIVHSYRWRGTDQASLVDYRFAGLRRVEAIFNMIEDHRQTSIMDTMRNVRAVREAMSAGRMPPVWQSIGEHIGANDNSNDNSRSESKGKGKTKGKGSKKNAKADAAGETGDTIQQYVRCTVCRYFVGWLDNSTDSEAAEVRGTYHCYACGCVVCKECSTEKKTLPEIGILTPKRICDDCHHKITLVSAANNKDRGMDLGDLLATWESNASVR